MRELIKELESFDRAVNENEIKPKAIEYNVNGFQDRHRVIGELISFIDLTLLDKDATEEDVKSLCLKGQNPIDSEDVNVSAICVYPELIGAVQKYKTKPEIRIDSVEKSFPHGNVSIEEKVNDIRRVIELGADEIDIVLNREEFLKGNFEYSYDEVKKIKEACLSAPPKESLWTKVQSTSYGESFPQEHFVGPTHKAVGDVLLKVILETCELGSLCNVRKASFIAMYAGADFIKTSTGKAREGATLEGVLVMAEAIKDFYERTDKVVGLKAAGGIRETHQAFGYYNLVNKILGSSWLNPKLFRIGASTLLDSLIREYSN